MFRELRRRSPDLMRMTGSAGQGIRRKGTVVKSREAREGLQVGEAKRVWSDR
ncbi:unnamed protein product [Gulo gulo]|uniref:Uncharacterized protein n=1 Tax=Gulo gulo TaxID=48420 RepID=A0A9X9Q273_GULGU|nr:unnamed protein product [Gulo gulo]